MWAYGDAVGNLGIVIACHGWRVDHVFANQVDCGVPHSRRAVQQMALNSVSNIFLKPLESASHSYDVNVKLAVNNMLGSLVTIWPNARSAFVRMNTGGASNAARITLRTGWKEFLMLWMFPTSSASRSICATSPSAPVSKTSLPESFQTSRRASFTFLPNASTCPTLILDWPSEDSVAPHCFNTKASSWPQVAAVSSRALYYKEFSCVQDSVDSRHYIVGLIF